MSYFFSIMFNWIGNAIIFEIIATIFLKSIFLPITLSPNLDDKLSPCHRHLSLWGQTHFPYRPPQGHPVACLKSLVEVKKTLENPICHLISSAIFSSVTMSKAMWETIRSSSGWTIGRPEKQISQLAQKFIIPLSTKCKSLRISLFIGAHRWC